MIELIKSLCKRFGVSNKWLEQQLQFTIWVAFICGIVQVATRDHREMDYLLILAYPRFLFHPPTHFLGVARLIVAEFLNKTMHSLLTANVQVSFVFG